jgi:hypothetical protein
MKKLNKNIVIGTKVQLTDDDNIVNIWHKVATIHENRLFFKVDSLEGSFQTGHIAKYTNRKDSTKILYFCDLSMREQKQTFSDSHVDNIERMDDYLYFRKDKFIYCTSDFCTNGMPEGTASNGYFAISIDSDDDLVVFE